MPAWKFRAGIGHLISREIDSDKVYYVYNGHGDVTAITSNSSVVIKSYYYDAFGVILAETGNFSNPYLYSGYFYDSETGLCDLKARFYDANARIRELQIELATIRNEYDQKLEALHESLGCEITELKARLYEYMIVRPAPPTMESGALKNPA